MSTVTQRDTLYHCAEKLERAEKTRVPVPPLTKEYPSLTIDDAYAIQAINVERLLSHGAAITGKKIGLTSPGMQQLLGVNEPDYGHLFGFMECKGDVPAAELIQPKIESEIAFILKEDLPDREVSPEDVKKATAYVVAAFEIVDSRVADWKIKLTDTIADNASSARYVLGDTRLPIDGVDLSAVTMQMEKDGEELVSEGSGAAVMGDPAVAVAWLANCMRRYGVPLKKDEVLLSGAFCAALPAKKGDCFKATFSQLGTVTACFV
ncbi:MAG TPA: 2-keto-4-pentenoate hydratase [Eubacteriales bacterium]|nr:2-keto-4-pentenoate hydratase [Eubacteriales bacterium]